MARRRRNDVGEKRSAFIGFQVTPSERTKFEAAAAATGATLSQHARELCLRRSGRPQVVAGTRRNPESRELLNALMAIGNNLNQLSKHCNTAETAPQLAELRRVTDMLVPAISRIISL